MSASMSPRENFLACLQHKPHEFTPAFFDMAPCGLFQPFERGEGGMGVDAFGVRWVAPTSGGFAAALPAPNEFKVKDITKWRDDVTIPDVSGYDWAAAAERDLAHFDRDKQVLECVSQNFVYERLAAMMGFEEALLAMALEPEAAFEFMEAVVNWKIEVLKYYVKYYQPDLYTFCDDVATERMLFMAPATYRELIKPLHKKMVDAASELGVPVFQHTCGKADLLVQDMLDEGNVGWNAVQPTNDIQSIIEQHGDNFVIMGGYNTNGAPGQLSATEAEVRAEVRRCFADYAKYGRAYIFMGSVLQPLNPENPFDMGPLNAALTDEFFKCRAEQLQ